MKDEDRKKDDDKKKDSLCELVSLYEGLCPSSQLDSESCLVLLMRSPSTMSSPRLRGWVRVLMILGIWAQPTGFRG